MSEQMKSVVDFPDTHLFVDEADFESAMKAYANHAKEAGSPTFALGGLGNTLGSFCDPTMTRLHPLPRRLLGCNLT